MALVSVYPLPGNHCVGEYDDGTPDIQLLCLKGMDEQEQPIYTCATWRKFKVQCPKINQQCSTLSEAWVPAITVCNQRLW